MGVTGACSGQYHSLHFRAVLLSIIAYCLREGLQRFEPGAGGEHKIARGYADDQCILCTGSPIPRSCIG